MAQSTSLQRTLLVVVVISVFGIFIALADDPVCDEDTCDWAVQYCCGNDTCCNFQCETTGNASCNSKTHYCCGNDTCCKYDCNGGCHSDQFCCGRNPHVCCSDGFWHARWWTWLLVSIVSLLFLVSIYFVCRTGIRKARSPTYRSSDPYEDVIEKSANFESSLKYVSGHESDHITHSGSPGKSKNSYQSLS